jgi:hypothetical protein
MTLKFSYGQLYGKLLDVRSIFMAYFIGDRLIVIGFLNWIIWCVL